MKDGSVYTGYISRQSFIDKSITVSAVSALMVKDEGDVIIDSILSMTPISALESEMRIWLNKHSYILPDSSSNYKVPIAVIEDKKKQRTYRNALLVQRGEKVKFITCEDENVNVKTNDIVKMTRTVRPAGVLSGLNERFSIKKHEGGITGQVVCQDMINGIIYILGEKGYQFSFNNSDVISRSEILIDSELPYIEQCPFIETVHTKDTTFCGFISKQVFGTKESSGYLLVQTANSQIDSVKYSDITEIHRNLNEQYKSVILPEISDNEYYVCNTIAYPCNLTRVQNKDGDTYYVNENNDSTKMHIILNINSIQSGVKVQIKSDPHNKSIFFVPLKDVESPKLIKKINAEYYFNLNNKIFPKGNETKHGIDIFTFEIELYKGHYVLFREDKLEAVWIEIR